MKLSYSQIAALVHGASELEIQPDRLSLHRLTREQEAFLVGFDPTRLERAECPAGITLQLRTSSRELTLEVLATQLTGRRQQMTVYADGVRVAAFDMGLHAQPTALTCQCRLPAGDTCVTVYLPAVTRLQITGMALEDGATLEEIPERPTKLLLLGDSITQGYDAVAPEESYAMRLAQALDAEVRNRAIGGDIFRPAYPLLRDGFEPQVVTVAYGTNDWSAFGKDLLRNCGEFFRNLKKTYPHARLYALLPLWRKDEERITDFGALCDLNPAMRRVIEEIGGITVVDCFEFLGRDPSLLTDTVHPSAEGHARYAQALIPYIQ